jgi:hypothetical protein
MTEVAPLRNTVLTELGNTKGACLEANTASRALLLVHRDNSVFFSLKNGTLRAGREARRNRTMSADDNGIVNNGVRIYTFFGGYSSDPENAIFKIVPAYAGPGTGIARNAQIMMYEEALMHAI